MKAVLNFLCLAAICTACSRDSDVPREPKKYAWTTQLTRRNGKPVAKGMLVDTNASSADPSKPAFLAPPPGSKPYHGFPIIESVAIDGFKLGTVTDYLQSDCADGCTIGDAFVEAPDGTRAGLTWEVGGERMFSRIQPPETNRWGVYYFSVSHAVKSPDDFRKNFSEILPTLKRLYREAKGNN